MLQLHIEVPDKWDPIKEEFILTPAKDVQLEHSLISIVKWESHYHKPFLRTQLTGEELLYYISNCMCITKNVDEDIFRTMDRQYLEEVKNYIADPMTATPKLPGKEGTDTEMITNELIYYWMTQLSIPWEAERWHLNRLMKLIELANYKNTPPEKRSKIDMAKSRREENDRRRALWKTKG